MNITDSKGYLRKNLCNVDVWVKRTLKQVSSEKMVFICEVGMGYISSIQIIVYKCRGKNVTMKNDSF